MIYSNKKFVYFTLNTFSVFKTKPGQNLKHKKMKEVKYKLSRKESELKLQSKKMVIDYVGKQ